MRFAGMAVAAAAMLAGGIVLGPAPARADEVPLDLDVQQQAAQAKSGSAAAPAQALKNTISFSLSLHNKRMDDLSGVGVKLYVMAGANSSDINVTKQNLRVVKVLSMDGLKISSSQDTRAWMGSVTFASSSSTSVSGYGSDGSTFTSTSYAGDVYRGYVAEIYLDGKLADVRIGNGAMKKAYDDYLANPFPAAIAPGPQPGGRFGRTAPLAVLSLVSPAPGGTEPVPNLPAEVSLGFSAGMGPLPLPPRPADAAPSDEPVQPVGDSVSFNVLVRNLGAADLANAAVKVFAITRDGFAGGSPGVGAVLGAGPLAVAANGTAAASLGPAVVGIMPMGGLRPAGGGYLGYALEFYLDGNLMGVAASSPMVRQIYDASVLAHPDRPLYAGLGVPWVAKGGGRPAGQASPP